MTVSQAQLASFKEVYQKQYGETLSDSEAYEMASNLLGLYITIYIESPDINDDDMS